MIFRKKGFVQHYFFEKKSNAGFTLVEMLVTVAILVFMVTTVLGNTHGLSLSIKVKEAASIIIDTAKDTRSKSISVKEFTPGIFPSYAIHFETANPNRVTVFADCAADDNDDGIINDLDSFAWDSSGTSCEGGNGLVEHIPFHQNVKIISIEATYPIGGVMTTSSESRADIQFLRPEPTIWITDGSGDLLPVGYIDVTVADLGNEYQKTVRFYSSGQFFIR